MVTQSFFATVTHLFFRFHRTLQWLNYFYYIYSVNLGDGGILSGLGERGDEHGDEVGQATTVEGKRETEEGGVHVIWMWGRGIWRWGRDLLCKFIFR
jgi:hypothetical protein